MIKREMGDNIIYYQLPSPDGDVIVGVGLLGLVLIQMPLTAAAQGAVLQSEDVIEALVDADSTLARRYRCQLRISEMRWLDTYLGELRDEIENQTDSGWNNEQLELFNSDDYSTVVQQHDMGF